MNFDNLIRIDDDGTVFRKYPNGVTDELGKRLSQMQPRDIHEDKDGRWWAYYILDGILTCVPFRWTDEEAGKGEIL